MPDSFNSSDTPQQVLNQFDNIAYEETPPTKPKKPAVPFWTENPNVLFQSEYMFEFFPVETMTYSQKMNAIIRAIVLLGLFIFVFTQNIHVFIILAITIGAVSLVFYNRNKSVEDCTLKNKKSVRFDLANSNNEKKEGFTSPSDELAKHTLRSENVKLMPNLFDESQPSNPFSNVLLTDYEHNPTKKPAPASYTKTTNDEILKQAKAFVKQANPDQPDIADKLFNSLGEELQFEQSMRPFYSNPSTTIPNDQQAFADFCYGSMVSCKEGNMFACSRKYQSMPAI
jgi:hypothetical protein